MNKLIYIIPSLMTLIISSCDNNTSYSLIKDEKYGGIYINTSVNDFNNKFKLGDSLNISFSNGEHAEDIPYYNGYYGRTNDLVIVSYPNGKNPGIHRCQGSSTYKEFKINNDTKVIVTLNESAKYLYIQEALDLKYSNDINDYAGDKVRFSNFFKVEGSKLKQELFYRSCSPCDNKYKRAAYASKLLEENKIEYSINISDSKEKYESLKKEDGFMIRSSYYNSLATNNKVDFLGLGVNYRDQNYITKTSDSLNKFIKAYERNEVKNCHFHCEEGKDRTGFFSFLILSLVGSSEEEITKDYMKTYYNYYGISEEIERIKYNAIVYLKVGDFVDFFKSLAPTSSNYIQDGAKEYLKKGGISDSDINNIITKISK